MSALQLERDSEGYLVDPELWSESVAETFAKEEGITLNEHYWNVLNFIRQHWNHHHVAPDVRHVVKYLAEVLAMDKKQAKQHLFELFPYGYVKQACKISGMKRPRNWSTG